MEMLGGTLGATLGGTIGGTWAGWTFFAATVGLFGWGLYLGGRGLMANHPPFRKGANARGAGARAGFDAA